MKGSAGCLHAQRRVGRTRSGKLPTVLPKVRAIASPFRFRPEASCMAWGQSEVTRARVIGSGPSACQLGEAYGSQGDKRCSGAASDFGDGGARASGGMLNRCPRSTVGEHMPDPRITPCVLGPAAIAPSSFSIWNPLSLPAAAVVAVLARHGSEHVKHHAIDGGKHALGELARCRCAQPKMAGALQSCMRLSRRRSARSRPCGRKGSR